MTQAEKCLAWRGPPLLAVGEDFAGSPAAKALQPLQWSHFSPHCSRCHHKAFLDLKGWKQQVRLRLCHARYSQDDEGPRVKIIKRKLEVSLQEWTRLCRWLLIELPNAIFTRFTSKTFNILLTFIQLQSKQISQNHGIFWGGRDPQGSPSPTLKWMGGQTYNLGIISIVL